MKDNKPNENPDETYEAGYRRLPKTPDMGEAQMSMLSEVLPEEDWEEQAR